MPTTTLLFASPAVAKAAVTAGHCNLAGAEAFTCLDENNDVVTWDGGDVGKALAGVAAVSARNQPQSGCALPGNVPKSTWHYGGVDVKDETGAQTVRFPALIGQQPVAGGKTRTAYAVCSATVDDALSACSC